MAARAKKTTKTPAKKTKAKTKPKSAPKKKIVAKPKVSRKLKSKNIDIYADSVEVSLKKDQLKALEQDRKEIEKSIKEIIDTYNSKSANNRDAERFLDKLPLDSLRELQDYLNGKKKESNLDILKVRAKLRKDRNTKIDELLKIEEKISQGQIDLLIAKINHVIGKGDDTKKD
ncbi:MAG TPA: hypothetical protein VM577_14580 [Anaerovoracaceae bacterium]|nr:hypothetical protein [Anaerovoracaceae bacterium]